MRNRRGLSLKQLGIQLLARNSQHGHHNDEIGMTNDELNPNDETRNCVAVVTHFFVIRISSFSHASFVSISG